MRIAVVTDDQETISQHFGRARYYLVFTIADGRIIQQELRPKLAHDQLQTEQHEHAHAHEHHQQPDRGHGYGHHAQDKHRRMMANIGDCQVLLCGGMGMGARESLERNGIAPILTDVSDIRQAVWAYLNGALPDHVERLH